MNAQYYHYGRTRDAGLLCLEDGVFIFSTWFAMRYFPWRRLAIMLYWCCIGILWVYDAFLCATEGIGTVSYGTTIIGGAGAASVVVSGVFTLWGVVTCGGSALLKISESFLSATVCLSPSIVSGLVGVGLRRVWVRLTAACVASSLEDSIGKVSVARKNPWCLRLFL